MPANAKAKATLNISKGFLIADNIKAKFFYKISNINNGVVTAI